MNDRYSTEPMCRDVYTCHLCRCTFSPKSEGVFIRCARHGKGHKTSGTNVLNDNILALCDNCLRQINKAWNNI